MEGKLLEEREREKVQGGSEGAWKEINSSGPERCGKAKSALAGGGGIYYLLLFIIFHLNGQLGLNHHSVKAERN